MNDEFDRAVVQIDEAAVVAPADILDVDHGGRKSGLRRGVLEIGQRSGILGISGHSGQMEVAAFAELFPGLDQAFVDRIELIGARGE